MQPTNPHAAFLGTKVLQQSLIRFNSENTKYKWDWKVTDLVPNEIHMVSLMWGVHKWHGSAVALIASVRESGRRGVFEARVLRGGGGGGTRWLYYTAARWTEGEGCIKRWHHSPETHFEASQTNYMLFRWVSLMIALWRFIHQTKCL